MTTDGALELFRNVLVMCAQVAGAPLAVALIVGLVVGVLQTATQVNEASVAFLVKLLAVGGTLVVAGPFVLAKLVEYTRTTIGAISEIVR